MKNHTVKILVIWFMLGALYLALEGIWRIPRGGYANIIMLPIGGLCGLLVGGINQIPKFYSMKVIYQSLIGTIITTAIELSSGVIINIWLGLGIWDYSNVPLNLLGQICLPYSILWLFIMPACIWVEDAIRYSFWNEGTKYSLKTIYTEFFTGK